MPTYKTPGVYVEEISVFPPSVAEVETAVPAFIGYTEKHDYRGNNLKNVPTEVDSLLEYQARFGSAPPLKITKLDIAADSSVTNVDLEAQFYMYDSLRMFFQNGGGKCYILSIGTYLDNGAVVAPSKPDFEAGLNALKKKDEPTLILFPDAVLLDQGLYDLQQLALSQANTLQDRFVIMDLLEPDPDPSAWKTKYQEFRNKVGVNYLKYGAAYTPYLKSTLPRDVKYRELKDALPNPLKNMTSDPSVVYTIDNLERAIGEVDTLLGSGIDDLASDWNDLVQDFKTAANDDGAAIGDVRTKFIALYQFLYDQNKAKLDAWTTSLSTYPPHPVSNAPMASLKQAVVDQITHVVKDCMITLNQYNADFTRIGDANVGVLFGQGVNQPDHAAYAVGDTFDPANYGVGDTHDATAALAKIFPNDDGDDAASRFNMKNAEPFLSTIFKKLLGVITRLVNEAKQMEANFEDSLKQQFPTFKNITAGINGWLGVMPPSGAIAGVYAAVDGNRGVWKAPANVSLNTVAGVTVAIDSEDQEDLNVDVNAGKSINALRFFTGKGVMVWGARTLAGNDNEWRYVPVRRFFNMVEESVRKSTSWAVFEPNDANLWVKVKGMIENYLVQKWREGALAGAKPEHAFFVSVGLGKTMSAQDILEGRLIVEIGMAVVRPAEFIVLRFSHKMQQS